MSQFRERREGNYQRSLAWGELHPQLTLVVIGLIGLLTLVCALGAIVSAMSGDVGELLFLLLAGAYGVYSLRTWLRVRREVSG